MNIKRKLSKLIIEISQIESDLDWVEDEQDYLNLKKEEQVRYDNSMVLIRSAIELSGKALDGNISHEQIKELMKIKSSLILLSKHNSIR